MGTLTKISFCDHKTHDSGITKISLFASLHKLHKITITRLDLVTIFNTPS